MSLPSLILPVLLLSAFFSGMETAFISADKIRLELDKKSGLLTSKILQYITKNPGHYIAAILIGKNIALIIFSIAFSQLIEPSIEIFTGNEILVMLIQIFISASVILALAEFMPKSLFLISPNRLLILFSWPLALFYSVFYPITAFAMGLSKTLLKIFIKKPMPESDEDKVFGIADLGHFVNTSASENSSQQETIGQEVKLFRNALDFSKIKLREVMVPRTEIEAMDINSDIESIRQKFIETGFSKILFYKGNIDNITGYIHSSEMFKNPATVEPLLIDACIVPETMPANKLLSMFIREHRSLAVVVDEFGGTSGIVTSEDILEEIFGEIEDEHDTSNIFEKQTGPNEYVLSGRSEIDSLNEKFGLNIPESDDFETLAGFILSRHKSIPKINTVIEAGTLKFKILKASNTKIELVHLTVSEN